MIIIIMGSVSKNILIKIISKTEKLDFKNIKSKETKTTKIPVTTKSLPTYLFDLYQISSLDRVLGSLKPYSQLGLTFSRNNGNPSIISIIPSEIKAVINIKYSFIVIHLTNSNFVLVFII